MFRRTVHLVDVGTSRSYLLLSFWRRVAPGRFLALAGFFVFAGHIRADTQTFSNGTPITIPDSGAGIPYPSTIPVSGMVGMTTKVEVTLAGFNHTWAADVDVLLVGPAQQAVRVMSDVGSGFAPSNVTVTLSDFGTSLLPSTGPFVSGTYLPTDYDDNSPGGDDFPTPAPTPPFASLLSVFNGTGPNGTWSLYVFDDGPGDQGSLAGGWSLTITTTAQGPLPPTISDIADQTTVANVPTTPLGFTVSDADTPLNNLFLTGSSNNTTLVPNQNIVFGGSGGNRTITVTPAANQAGTAMITVTVNDGTNGATDSFLLTVDAPPTISNIVDQTINEDNSTGPLAFTVGDAETAAGSLTVSGSSSNTTLVPNSNIVFGGSGANRTVTVTPAANQNGTATITVTVSDGLASTSETFLLTVSGVNDPPTISNILDVTITTNGTTGPLTFTVGDAETPAGSLTVSGSSNNHSLVPDQNIVFGGSGASRSVTVTPLANQIGTATITVTVSDGQLTANDTFVLSVVTNSPPTIDPIANQIVYVDQPTIIKLELTDLQTPVADLQLSLETDNPNLFEPEDYEFRYFFLDGHRYLTIAGAFGQTGSGTNTVTVSDGTDSASTSFLMTVLPPPTGAARFANTSPITIPDMGEASTYPSVINVSGMNGTITKLELTASRFAHQYPADIAMLLVGPTGVGVVFLSNAGGGALVNNTTFTVSDSALFPFDPNFQIWSELFRPTNYSLSDFYPPPAPAGPYAPVAFSSYNGLTANGAWSLYVYDGEAPDHGQIAGGWSLLVATTGGSSNATPTPTPVGISGSITYCSNPSLNPVPTVTVTLTGDASSSTSTNGSGNYTLSVPPGGNYTVTPSKAALVPASPGITTVDVIGIQRHFLTLGTPLSGCRLTAADVNGVNGVNTVDVIAVQRFFLGFSTGIASTGSYKFTPTNRTYSGIVTAQTGQDYSALIFGDIASPFIY